MRSLRQLDLAGAAEASSSRPFSTTRRRSAAAARGTPLPATVRRTNLVNFRREDCLQCFDAVGWATGRESGLQKTEWWGAGVAICLEQGADLYTAQLMPVPMPVPITVSCVSKVQTRFRPYLSGTGLPE